MARYIDADKLKKDVLDLQDCYNGFSDTYDKACIIDVIDEQPSADVRENVRGEWTLVTDRYGANGEYVWKCSSCNKMTICKGDFCPNCGCEMER